MMRQAFINPRRLLVFATVVCLLSAILPLSWSSPVATVPRNLLDAMTVPFTGWLHGFGNRVRPTPIEPLIEEKGQEWQQLFLQQKQYTDRLEQRIAELQRRLASYQMVDGVVLQPVRQVVARVGRMQDNASSPTLVIDHGEDSGIDKGMAVVFDVFFVGQVEKVGNVTSTVQLITAENASVKVRFTSPDLQDRQARQPTEEHIEWNEDSGVFVTVVDQEKPIQVGDLAQLSDERYARLARGFFLGRVTEIIPDPQNPLAMRQVTVEPTVPFRELSEVTVLVPVESN